MMAWIDPLGTSGAKKMLDTLLVRMDGEILSSQFFFCLVLLIADFGCMKAASDQADFNQWNHSFNAVNQSEAV